MLILDKANPSFAIILAIVAGMVAGTMTAPPRYMWLAPKIFFGLAVLTAVGIFLRAVVARVMTFAHYFALLSVVIAGFLGRQMLTLASRPWAARRARRQMAAPSNRQGYPLFAYILCLWFLRPRTARQTRCFTRRFAPSCLERQRFQSYGWYYDCGPIPKHASAPRPPMTRYWQSNAKKPSRTPTAARQDNSCHW